MIDWAGLGVQTEMYHFEARAFNSQCRTLQSFFSSTTVTGSLKWRLLYQPESDMRRYRAEHLAKLQLTSNMSEKLSKTLFELKVAAS